MHATPSRSITERLSISSVGWLDAGRVVNGDVTVKFSNQAQRKGTGGKNPAAYGVQWPFGEMGDPFSPTAPLWQSCDTMRIVMASSTIHIPFVFHVH
jgi:hypothetical protein